MAAGTSIDSGTGLPNVVAEGGMPNGCQWDRSVCVDSPTHFITWGAHGDDSAELTTSAYCARHYAVELAHYTELHIRGCRGSATDHVSKFGEF